MGKVSERRQAQMLAYIQDFRRRYGYPPAIRDIQEGCGITSTAVVHYNLERLREQGKVSWEPGMSRTLRVLV